MPSAISVNMLSRRLTSEVPPRRKNGDPHHSTTGVASANCSQIAARGEISASSAGFAKSAAMARATSGNDRATPTQNRRVISASSGLTVSVADGVVGSRAMPQIGQLPGLSRRICGCIGQVHWAPTAAGAGSSEPAGVR